PYPTLFRSWLRNCDSSTSSHPWRRTRTGKQFREHSLHMQVATHSFVSHFPPHTPCPKIHRRLPRGWPLIPGSGDEGGSCLDAQNRFTSVWGATAFMALLCDHETSHGEWNCDIFREGA